jgi:hypothetical protein
MHGEESVLVLGAHSAHMGDLADRARDLGFRTVRVKTPEEAIDLARERNLVYGVGLIEADGFAFNLREALEAVRYHSNSPHLRYIATGPTPTEADRVLLRDAGVERALWSPLEEHALRFQLNAALSASHEACLRNETRVPIDAQAIVRAGGRKKQASVYSLSAGGAFLETPRPSMPGAVVEVALLVAGVELSLTGRVLYTNVPGNLSKICLPLGMAVCFQDLRRSTADAIRELVASNAISLAV